MQSAELVIDYSNLDKPFKLIERVHDFGGTDYSTICRLTERHARLLNKEGIGWLYGAPDWKEHWAKIERFRLEKEIAEKQAQLERLQNANQT